MNVHVLMTVYQEGEFLDYAIRSCLPYVKTLTIVEGAYRETIAVGASPRSTDNTLTIAKQYVCEDGKVKLLYANEKSDPQQRNVGLQSIKQIDPNGWMLIIDGDEVYEPFTFKMIDALIKKMEANGHRAAYFKSLTFVNDLQHYCEQEFPRLFKLTPDCFFVNDNHMQWNSHFSWHPPEVIKVPVIKFFHYSFCKSKERFNLKKEWWQNRFQDRSFEYSWHINQQGKIDDKSHVIRPFAGKHPQVMRSHPLYL